MCEDTPGRSLTPSAMGGYSKKTATYEPGSDNSESVTTLILDDLGLNRDQIARKGFVISKLPSI